ncbi:MAG: HAD family hydrolase [Promethearchaeota archaeon]
MNGLILDMDGTIIDSKRSHLEAWKLLLKKYNILRTDFEIISHFGKTTEEIAKGLFPTSFDPVKTGAEKDEIFLTLISNIYSFSGVSELFVRLKYKKYLICIASSNPIKTIQAICRNCNLEVNAIVGMEDVQHGKPAPDMIIKAASKLGLSISDCLVVGDSPYDIQAAKAANCKVIAVLTGSHSLESLKNENPDFIIPAITKIEDILKKFS